MSAYTLLKLGYSDPRTDAFGAHPLLGAALDLNDGATFTLVSPDGLELSAPEKTLVPTGNIRTQGERVTRAIYRRNRTAVVRLIMGPSSSYASFIASVRALVRWLDAAPATPFCLQWQPPSATAPVYLDVVGAAHGIPADEREWLRLQLEPIEIVFVVRPGLRGDRVTLSNLVVNPGFEAGSGVGVQVFSDSFANLDAYSGTGLTQDVTTYRDAVLADNPVRYYRLDETSGTTAADTSSSAANGTYSGGFTLNTAGLLVGSADAAVTLNGTTGEVSCSASGLPTGNNTLTLEVWVKLAALPSAVAIPLGYGNGGSSGQNIFLQIDTGGHVSVGGLSATTAASAALSMGVAHHLVGIYDSSVGKASCYVDGVLTGAAVTVAGPAFVGNTLTIGVAPYASGNFLNGVVDEAAVYTTALSSTRISAHYTAGHTGPQLAANTLQIPAGNTATFGSSAWGALNQWQVRFRYRSGMTAMFNAHVTAGGSMGAEVGGNTLYLQQTVSGTQHILANASFITTDEAWYWLTFTQFPTVAGVPCDVQASIYADSNGSLGSLITSISATPTYDAVTALSGQAQFQVNGAALGVGGANVTRSTHSLQLFGPGGWLFFPTDSTTGPASGSWDQNTANTYTGGAVTSFGAARIDAAPAGTLGGNWETYAGGAVAGTSAIPAAPSQTFGVSAWVKATGVGASCAQTLQVLEYDTNGNYLRGNTVATHTGASGWVQLTGSYVTGASCAWIALRLEALDTTTGSVNGTVWFENVQCWNVTTTGQATMPYCELRFPQSPAQLLVTGLLGDLPAPAHLAWGTYLSSWVTGSTLAFALGRRARASANARMVAPSQGYYGPGLAPQATAYLDSSAYGGYYAQALANPQWNPRAFSFPPADLLGVFHLFNRFFTSQSAPNLGNLETRMVTQQKTQAWFGALDSTDQVGAYYDPYSAPISAASTWTVCDAGQANVPALPSGALTDLTTTYLTPRSQWGDTTAGGSTCRSDWQMLLPVDGSLLVGMLNNPSNAPFTVTARWLWVYHDGLLLNRSAVGDTAATTYSVESLPTANPANGAGGPGTASTGVINVNGGADPALILDPSVSVAATASAAGGSGVNQVAGYVADNAGAVLPLHAEIQYSPLYLYPR